MRSLLYVVALVACAFVFIAIVSEGGEEVNWYGTLWVLIPLVVSMAITIPIAKFTYNNYDEIIPRYNRRSNVAKFESQWKYTLDRATVSANMLLIVLIPIMLFFSFRIGVIVLSIVSYAFSTASFWSTFPSLYTCSSCHETDWCTRVGSMSSHSMPSSLSLGLITYSI